jgi:hypothetical protein
VDGAAFKNQWNPLFVYHSHLAWRQGGWNFRILNAFVVLTLYPIKPKMLV